MTAQEIAYYVDRHGIFGICHKKKNGWTGSLRIHHGDEDVIRDMKATLGFGAIGIGERPGSGEPVYWINFEGGRTLTVCTMIAGRLVHQKRRLELMLEFGALLVGRRRSSRNGRKMSEEETAHRERLKQAIRDAPRPGEEVRYVYRRIEEA